MISDADVAEVPYTVFAGTGQAVTARLVVRRVRVATSVEDEMFPSGGTTVVRHSAEPVRSAKQYLE